MNNEFITENIINNLIAVMKIAVDFSVHPEASGTERQESWQYFTGCEFPFFNGVFNYNHNQASDDLTEVTQFFVKKNTPFIWWWLHQSEIPETKKKELNDQGFQFLGEYLGIAAKLDQVNLNSNVHDKQIKID